MFSMISDLMKEKTFIPQRDAFFDLLRQSRLLVRRYKTKVVTTDSRHRFRRYPNLIRELMLGQPHELWVSDITYVETGGGYLYLSLITDAYSRNIVGWNISPKLEASGVPSALHIASLQLSVDEPLKLIHHSDRGIGVLL